MTNHDALSLDDARKALRRAGPTKLPATEHYSGTPLTHDVGERVDDTMTVIEDHEDEGDLDLWLRVYADAQGAIAQLQVLMDECERRALDHIANGATVTTDVGSFTVKKPARVTRWSDSTLDHLIRNAREAGELNGPDDFVQLVKEACGISYYRVGPLRHLGLEPNDYREQEFYPRRLRRI